MDSLEVMRERFRRAFAAYSQADARLRRLRAELPASTDSAAIHGVNAEYVLLVTAERDYRATRLDYIHRLLPRSAAVNARSLTEVPMTKIYVRNLGTDATKKSVRLLFEPYGNVMRIRLGERQHAKLRGKYAFVDMADAEASEAVRSLHGSRQGMQVLHVIKAGTARAIPKQGVD